MTATWTLDDVKKAGINNANYNKYPRAMLYARASAELVRQVAPDCLGGIGLFAEEAQDIDVGAVTIPEDAQPPRQTRQRVKATTTPPVDTQAIETPAELPALPDEEPVAGPTDKQIKKMMACFNDIGIKDKPDRLAFITAAVRTVESSKDLTIGEAATVIDQLESVIDGRTAIRLEDDGTATIHAITPPAPDVYTDEEPF